MKKEYNLWYYMKRNELISIVLFGFFLLIGLFLTLIQPRLFTQAWGDWLEFFLAFSTLAFVLVNWYRSLKKSYRDSLPKKLNITYIYQHEKWYIKNAPLTGEADIRAWGQSLGSVHFNQARHYKFKSFNIEKTNHLKHKTVYNLTIYLDEKFTGKNAHDEVRYKDNGRIG